MDKIAKYKTGDVVLWQIPAEYSPEYGINPIIVKIVGIDPYTLQSGYNDLLVYYIEIMDKPKKDVLGTFYSTCWVNETDLFPLSELAKLIYG